MQKRLPVAAFYGLAGLLALLDQATKALVRLKMPLDEAGTIALWPGVFHLTHTTNRGMAFSLLWNQRALLVLAAVVVMGVIVVTERRSARRSGGLEPLQGVGLALAFAGAIGNLTDRIRHGFVTDFLDFRLIHFPIFNVADSCITIGIGLLLWHSLLAPGKSPEPAEAIE